MVAIISLYFWLNWVILVAYLNNLSIFFVKLCLTFSLLLPLQELQSRQFWCSLLAEATGTLIFVWIVLGASSPAGPKDVLPTSLQPALAAGLVAISLAHCFGKISGAQVNPALTMAFLCTRKLDALHASSYILAQCLGAILASGFFYLVLPSSAIGQLVTKVS